MLSDWRTRCLASLILCYLLLMAPAGAASTNNAFARGLDLSRAGQFPEASAIFGNEARQHPATGTLVNWGLAEWQRGHAGPAILAWEQARWINPFDSRAEANLNFARQVAQVDEPQLKWFETVSTWLPPSVWAWLTTLMLWLAVGILVLPGILRWRKRGWHQLLAALAFGIFLFGLTANCGLASRTDIGFVLKKNTPLLLTPTQDGETVFTAAAGEPARRLRTHGHFAFVRTLSGAGWIDESSLGMVCPR